MLVVNQIAIFLENKKGTLKKLMKALADANVNVKSLNIADTSDFGICRIVTDDNKKALEIIKANNYAASDNDLIGIEVNDKPGTLADTLDLLDANGIDIEYIYSYTLATGKTIILIKSDDMELAKKVLK